MVGLWIRVCTFGLLLVAAASLLAQRGGRQSGNNLPTTAFSDLVVHGSVVMQGGTAPERLVLIERLCGGRVEATTYADSKGRFSFDLGVVDRGSGSYGRNTAAIPDTVLSAESTKDCSVRASLLGYRPQTISLDQAVKDNKTELGEMRLEPFGKQESLLTSSTENGVPKNAIKDYEKGLDAAAKSKWQDAIGAMEKATSAYPKFASAWLALGILQSSQKNLGAALQSYERAITADEGFAPPYIESAALESASAQWAKVIEHTSKAISLAPDSFAGAYYLSAMANVRLNQTEAAQKSVSEGLRVDQDHTYPDLEYIDGILRMSKGDSNGARTQFQAYLALDPNGINAENARHLLTELQGAK